MKLFLAYINKDNDKLRMTSVPKVMIVIPKRPSEIRPLLQQIFGNAM